MDFDGVINSYESGWTGEANIPDPPVPGIGKAMKAILIDGYDIVIQSARAATEEGRQAILQYLIDHQLPMVEITSTKPPAHIYVDDKAICFDGNSGKLLDQIKCFKSWHGR
jgi:hypothetical protein